MLLLALLAMIPSLGKTQVVATMLVVDPFALFFKVLAVVAVALVILLAMPYLRGRTPYSGEFYALLLIVTLAICLAVSSVNLIMIYLSMEFLSITSYVLAGYLRQDRKSGEAAVKYFLYGATASAVMLYGMSLLFGATGTTDLVGIRNALAAKPVNELMWLTAPAIILLLAGFGFKASLVPFHQWAPDTYEGAPTPITAFLSTASKATGFAIMIRVFIVALGLAQMQWVALLVAVSVVTMTLGNLAALRQTNVKRLLAYSSIAQAGYILIGLAAVLADPIPHLHRPQRPALLSVRLPLHQHRRLRGCDRDRSVHGQSGGQGLRRHGAAGAGSGCLAHHLLVVADWHPAHGRFYGQVLRLRRSRAEPDVAPGRDRCGEQRGGGVLLLEHRPLHVLRPRGG